MERKNMTVPQDNPVEAWEKVDTVRRASKKKYVFSQTASFFSNILFMVLVLLTANGLIWEGFEGSYCDFLGQIPYFVPAWQQFSGFYRSMCDSFYALVGMTAAAVYVLCFLVSVVTVLLTAALYHPFRRKMPEGEAKIVTEQILDMARAARRYSNRTGKGGSMVCSLIFMIVQLVVVTVYGMLVLGNLQVVLEVTTAPIMNLVGPYLGSEMAYYSLQTEVFLPSLMLFFLAMYLAYVTLNVIHMLSVQFMYHNNVPYSFVAQAERLHIFTEHEEAVVENGQQLLEEALEYERLGAYGKAKQLLAEAAHGGNADAMEHYARHWLVKGAKDPAKYWLRKCLETGNASKSAVKTLRRLKWRLPVRARYIMQR